MTGLTGGLLIVCAGGDQQQMEPENRNRCQISLLRGLLHHWRHKFHLSWKAMTQESKFKVWSGKLGRVGGILLESGIQSGFKVKFT